MTVRQKLHIFKFRARASASIAFRGWKLKIGALLKRILLRSGLLHKIKFLYDCFHLEQSPADFQVSGAQDSVEKGPVSG